MSFFCCWHMNSNESDAMWKVYARTSGCAFVSTIGRLKEALLLSSQNIFLSRIEYIDFDKHAHQRTDMDVVVQDFLRKKRSFEHERELRALVYDVTSADVNGISIAIDPEKLIDRIVVSPFACDWLKALIQQTTARLEYDLTVIESDARRPTPLSLSGVAGHHLS